MFILILFSVISTLVIVFWYRKGYWQRRGIPGPPSTLFLGVLDRLGDFNKPNVIKYNKWTKEYGKVYGMQKGWKNYLVTSDPQMVHEMMTDKFDLFYERERVPLRGNPDTEANIHTFRARGERWKRLRTISNPAFAVQNLKRIMPVIEDSTLETVKLLEKECEKGAEFNIHPFFHEFTMDVIARIAMGQTESMQFRNEYTKLIVDLLSSSPEWSTRLAWMFPPIGRYIYRWQFLKSAFKGRGLGRLFAKVSGAVEKRKQMRASGEIDNENRDFIDFFLDAESKDVALEDKSGRVYDKSHVHVSKRLTTSEVIAQCNLFLFAGFDTTANTLALTAFHLAKRPDIQDRLREEILNVCGSGGSVSLDDLGKLKYAEALMKEVLRHHPIAAIAIARTCAKDTMLGEIPVEQETTVVADCFALHFDKSVWGEDADEFKPERWLGDRVTPPWYSFGAGPRVCLGMRLAYIEEKLALTYILRRFRILETPNTGSKPILVSNAVLNPKHVTVRLEALE